VVAGVQQVVMPAADFMPDEAFSRMVRCTRCDEEVIEAFKHDHFCDEQKLAQMMRNKQG